MAVKAEGFKLMAATHCGPAMDPRLRTAHPLFIRHLKAYPHSTADASRYPTPCWA